MSTEEIIGSPQQVAIWDALRDGSGHILGRARAGTGKTVAIIEGVKRMPFRKFRIAFVAFNKSIAKELQEKIPSSAKAFTLHSMALQGIKRWNPDVVIDTKRKKVQSAFDEAWSELPSSFVFSRLSEYRVRTAAVKCASLCKNEGYGIYGEFLDDERSSAFIGSILDHYDIDVPLEFERELMVEVVQLMLEYAADYVDLIDFDDMAWFPGVHEGITLPKYDLLVVDESQDLNLTQHYLVEQSAGERVLLAGDDRQQIYSWRGVSLDSIGLLTESLGEVDEFPLTVSRRCPQSVVELAKRLVPDFEAMPDAPEGHVGNCSERDVVRYAAPGDMILCRTNGPNLSMFYQLLAAGKSAFVLGRGSTSTQLIQAIKQLQADDMTEFHEKLARYEKRQVRSLEQQEAPRSRFALLEDKITCLRSIAEHCHSTSHMLSYVENMFSAKDRAESITLSSIHKAKGLEAKNVWILKPQQMPHSMATKDWEIEQELNCCYVAVTRSAGKLMFAGKTPRCL